MIRTRARAGDPRRRDRLREGRGAAGLVPHRRWLPLLPGAAQRVRAWTCSPPSSPTTGSATASSSPRRWPRWDVSLDIPSRVVVGFLDGSTQDDGRHPLHERRPARLAGDVLHRGGLGALRADPGRARRRHARRGPGSPQTPRRRRTARARPPAKARRRGPTRTAGRRRSPTVTGSCRVPRGRWSRWRCCWSWVWCPALVRVILRRRRLVVRRPGPPRRGGLGRAARDRTRPRAGLARAAFTARAGAQRGRPGAAPRTGTSSRWRGCWSGWSGDATARPRPTRVSWADAGWHARPGAALAHGGDGRVVAPGDGRQRQRERGWRGRIWPVSLVRRRPARVEGRESEPRRAQ